MIRFFASLIAVSTFAAEPVNFHRDVLPVLRTKCLACHTADGIGPFALDDYAEVRKRAGQISRIIADGIMPPWKPEGAAYAWDRRLTPFEAATFRHWVEAGAPEGTPPKNPPTTPEPAWAFGEPDMILTPAEPFAIPAEGRDLYVHYVFPLGLNEERQLTAVQVLPGTRRVTHSATGILDRSGAARERAGSAGRYELFGGPGIVPTGYTPGYIPGQLPMSFGDAAITLTPDTDFVLQVQYRPSGKPATDQPRVGLYFSKKPVARVVSGVFLGCEDIRIPAGEQEFKLRDSVKLSTAIRATEIRARMHRAGIEVHAWAELPDGKVVRLLDITDWDRDWAEPWRFAKPVDLPAGTRIRAEWVYDNSEINPRNPNRPPREIRAGDKETDEAAMLWLGGTVGSSADHTILTGANLTHYIDLANKARK